jgi:outer membrane lipoprotein carrier protein
VAQKLFLFTLIFLSSFAIQAKKTSAPAGPDLTILNQTTAKYRKAKMIQMSVLKTVKSDLTGKETNYKGTIYLSSGLFRMVNTEPEKSLLVFDGSTIWNEQPPSPDFPGPVQVTKSRLAGKNKSQALFATLLTKDPLTKSFKILSSKKQADQTVYEASPLTSELTIKSLTLKISNPSKQVSEISYKDDIGNLTVMKFTDPQFKNSLDKKLFQYKPPKGAQVNEI